MLLSNAHRMSGNLQGWDDMVPFGRALTMPRLTVASSADWPHTHSQKEAADGGMRSLISSIVSAGREVRAARYWSGAAS